MAKPPPEVQAQIAALATGVFGAPVASLANLHETNMSAIEMLTTGY